MKILKPLFFAATTILFLSSCGSSKAPIEVAPLKNANIVKTATLNDSQLKTWGAADLATDTIPGMSVNKAYTKLIPSLKGTNVIVAVIDSGVDIHHEDLKNVIWVNKKEIPYNDIDDDKNGYVDDVNGWNFLGDIVEENMEFVRIIKKGTPRFEGKTAADIGKDDKADFFLYEKAKAEYEKEAQEATSNKERYEGILSKLKPAHIAISAKLKTENYTVEDLIVIDNPNETEIEQIQLLTQMLGYSDTVTQVIEQLSSGVDYFGGRLDSHFNLKKDFRSILGDNPDDITDTNYGNNDVTGPSKDKKDIKHGTHVSGIIAAQRNNGIGMNGVAQNVEIMPIRAVPDGDEYDKDVALAIRYAVDNGAKVINTSFGKGYSPHPEWVWEAIKYAGRHDVLIVNAAGNDGVDLDIVQSYPSDQVGIGEEISENFITIGALNYKYGKEMVATFSNYGTFSVDLFAPGVKIWATTELSNYAYLQGTSMAAPGVAGVAAMIRSYYPNLSAKQVKQILMNSGLPSSTPVVLGGEASNVEPFNTVSKSGRIVNLYNALIMASKM